MGENDRDSGLVRSVGAWGLAASIVNTVVGAGIFAVPGALAACVGPYAPLAFLACAVAIGAISICFAEGGSRIPTSGGAYGYVQAAFGPLAGYVAGTLLWFSDALACGGIAAALVELAASLGPRALHAAVRATVIVAVIGGFALVNVRGVSQGARLVTILTVAKLVPLGVFIVAGATALHAANFAAAPAPDTQGLGRAAILALFVFTGMEGPLSASGEVSEPARSIPRALLLSMVPVTLLFVGIQVVAQGILGPALAHSTVPLADAMERVHPALRVLMLSGAAMSMFSWIGSDVFGTPRVLFAFARDGWLPSALGRLHPRSHAPHVAILTYSALTMTLALTGTFAELAVLSTLAGATLYIAGCAAALRLSRRNVAVAGAPLAFPGLGLAAAVGIGSMVLLITLASRAEILGLAALLTITTLVYVLKARTRLAPR